MTDSLPISNSAGYPSAFVPIKPASKQEGSSSKDRQEDRRNKPESDDRDSSTAPADADAGIDTEQHQLDIEV